MPYAKALDGFKDRLWEETKPPGRARRFITTPGGYRVYAETGGKHNRGAIFSWMVKGTIAEIINTASMNIIDGEEVEGDWRFCFPVHDAVYVIGKKKHAPVIASTIQEVAKKLGIGLKVKTEVF